MIIEDDVLIGGNSGIYEGTIVKRRRCLGTGTILNRSIPVYDLVRDAVYSASEETAPGHSGRRSGGSRFAQGDSCGRGEMGTLASDCGDREVSR